MSGEKRGNDGRTHTVWVRERSIPEAYWSAIKAVYDSPDLRTEYDRKDPNGKFIDPPGKDMRVLIEVEEPFAQPRFPVLSYCERGKYIAEILGAKDHLVVPYETLRQKIRKGGEFEATEWPYSYHHRLTQYPSPDGPLDQLEILLEKLAKSPISRRAVAITGVPEIDLFLKADAPCLREIQLRCLEDDQNQLYLNMMTRWRSRDLYKAWGDNVIGITNLQARLADRLSQKMQRPVLVGSYTDENGSLHIYGQDRAEKGAEEFLTKFPTKDSFVARAMSSEDATKRLILLQLEELKKESTWRFTAEAIAIIDQLIEDFETGRFIP